MSDVKFSVVNIEQLASQLTNLINDPTVKLEINNSFARYMDPYVPMDTGALASSGLANVTEDYVEYIAPYVHYMYEGIVYGPNIPITQDGVIVGWFSPPNQPKHPTGASIQYSTEKHPLATHHWDEAMMANRGEDFTAEVTRIITQAWNNRNGG